MCQEKEISNSCFHHDLLSLYYSLKYLGGNLIEDGNNGPGTTLDFLADKVEQLAEQYEMKHDTK